MWKEGRGAPTCFEFLNESDVNSEAEHKISASGKKKKTSRSSSWLLGNPVGLVVLASLLARSFQIESRESNSPSRSLKTLNQQGSNVSIDSTAGNQRGNR